MKTMATKKSASGPFLMLSSGRLNSVRQVHGDLPHPVVYAASAQFSTLSAHFSTLSTHARVLGGLPSLRSPAAVDHPHFAPYGENPGNHQPVHLLSLGSFASLAVRK
jgi:hypothetical protein